MKIQVVLPLKRETPGALVYGVADISAVAVGQVYVRKSHIEKENGAWPPQITLTLETPR